MKTMQVTGLLVFTCAAGLTFGAVSGGPSEQHERGEGKATAGPTDSTASATAQRGIAVQTLFGMRAQQPAAEIQIADAVEDALAWGKESDADRLLEEYLQKDPDNQKVQLLRAVVVRTRPDGPDATALFRKVVALNAGTQEGKCAQAMLDIDAGKDIPRNYQFLVGATKKNMANLLFVWIAALAAQRAHAYGDGTRFFAELGRDRGFGPRTARFASDDMMDVMRPMPGFVEYCVRDRELFIGVEPSPAAYRGQAQSLARAGQYDEALKACAAALKLKADYEPAIRVWASILFATSRNDEALAKVERALELDPRDFPAHTLRGRILEKKGRTPEAITEYKMAAMETTRLAPVPALRRPAEIAALPAAQATDEVIKYFSAGKQAEAESIIRALAVKYPKDVHVTFLYALVIRSRFEISEARPVFQKAVDLDAKSIYGQAAAWMLRIDGRNNPKTDPAAGTAFDELSRLIHAHFDDPLLLWMGGIASRTLDRNIEGIEFYRQLLTKFAVGPVLVYQTYGNLFHSSDDSESALPLRKMAVYLEPEGWSYDALGSTLADLTYYVEADAAHTAAVKLGPNNLLYRLNWARDLDLWGHYPQALKVVESALAGAPNDPQLLAEKKGILQQMEKPQN